LFNPVATVRWNARKTYLRDLAGAEIPVVPTAWVAAGDATGLEAILSAHGWRRAVVKPTISATAFETWRTGPTITTAEEHRFARVARERDLMIQPYLEQIETEGELSFVFLGERFSHAVVKRPAAGDFRVQSDFGGTVGVVRPAVALIQQATRALAAVPAPCLYARVDGCLVNGQLVLMELEAIEPVLFFRDVPWAAARFVEALHVTLDSSRRCENHALGSGAAPSSSPPPRTSQAS
jgi:glutathione synthase/RimK-type ligase-like ATP-grasp enzyme